jgi:hypothetical protein
MAASVDVEIATGDDRAPPVGGERADPLVTDHGDPLVRLRPGASDATSLRRW